MKILRAIYLYHDRYLGSKDDQLLKDFWWLHNQTMTLCDHNNEELRAEIVDYITPMVYLNDDLTEKYMVTDKITPYSLIASFEQLGDKIEESYKKHNGSPEFMPNDFTERERQILMRLEEYDRKYNYPDKIYFSPTKSEVYLGDKSSPIPYAKNEYYLCKVLFEHQPETPIEYDEIDEAINGDTTGNNKSIDDTIDLLNRRLKKDLGLAGTLVYRKNRAIYRRF